MKKIIGIPFMLMMYLAVSAVLLLLYGCCSRPPVRADISEDAASHSRTDVHAGDSAGLQFRAWMERASEEWYRRLWNLDIAWRRDSLSAPDSTGRQHTVITETVRIDSRLDEDRHTEDTALVHLEALETRIRELESRLEAVSSRRTDAKAERMARITWWQAALMFLGAVLAVYIIYKFYQKKP